MAIKIIKEGKKQKFTKTCEDCGCEFEYESEDLHTDYSICLTSYPAQYNTYVICPCCGKHIHHWYTQTPWYPNYPNIIYTNTGSYDTLDCDKCPNKGGLKDALGNPIAGDSPCDWCIKRIVTCYSGGVK